MFKYGIKLYIAFLEIKDELWINAKVLFYYLFVALLLVLFSLIGAAFFTFLERKLLASTQNRRGPNVVGYFGVLQAIADGIKLLLKEAVTPGNSYLSVFFLSSMYSLTFGLSFFIVYPFGKYAIVANINYGALFVFVISVLHVYSIILAGWSSNSKYSFLGGLRSTAQLIAYDIAMIMCILTIVLYTKSFNIYQIIMFQAKHVWFVFMFPLLFIIFFICVLAETNRHPFDLPEAESELVSGYNIEYSAVTFAFFFLGEYTAMLFMAGFMTNFFLGGWTILNWLTFFLPLFLVKIFSLILYVVKILGLMILFIKARAVLPRYRYDQLMRIGWKYLLPVVFGTFFINVFIVYFFVDFFTPVEYFKKII